MNLGFLILQSLELEEVEEWQLGRYNIRHTSVILRFWLKIFLSIFHLWEKV